jgi:hypothetical protein
MKGHESRFHASRVALSDIKQDDLRTDFADLLAGADYTLGRDDAEMAGLVIER